MAAGWFVVAFAPPPQALGQPESVYTLYYRFDVPPAVGPEVGLTPLTVGGGGARYVNWSPGFAALG